MDRVRTMTYPDGEVVTTTYNNQMLPQTLGGYVTNATYNPAGQLTTLTLGNGVVTNYGYHPQNLRLTSLVTSNGLQNLAYEYDNVGNITKIADTIRSEVLNLAYDDLDRLTSATGAYSQNWVYNPIGNITQFNGITYAYNDPAHKHAVTQVGSTAYGYDANGNMLTRGGDAFQYDYENRLTQAMVGGVVTNYDYNADGARIKKAVGSTTTYYIGNWFEVTTSPAPTPTPTFTPTNTPVPPTATSTPTNTPVLPTATPTATATPPSTNTPTRTNTPTATSTPTSTLVPPTVTPTNTSMPPTATPGPTNTPTPTPITSAFPSTSIRDNFNRSNGSIGNNWRGSTSGYSISSNRLRAGTGGDIYWRNAAYGADQEVYFTFTNVSTTSNEQGLLLKAQSNTTYGSGVIEVQYDATNQVVQVWTYAETQNWVQRGGNIPATFVNGDRFGARARANGTVEVYRNNTLIGTADVGTWPYKANGGYIGLWFANATGATIDDFGGGTATALPTSTPTATNTPALPTPTPWGGFTDNFDRADSSDLGANWTERLGDFAIVAQVLQNANTICCDIVATYNGATLSNVAVTARMQNNGALGTPSLGVRLGNYLDGLPTSGYTVELQDSGALVLWRVNDWTVLGSYTLSNYTRGNWVTVTLRASGTTLSVDEGGTTRITATDYLFTSGDVGVWSWNSSAVGEHRFDDFSVQPLTGGGRQVPLEIPGVKLIAVQSIEKKGELANRIPPLRQLFTPPPSPTSSPTPTPFTPFPNPPTPTLSPTPTVPPTPTATPTIPPTASGVTKYYYFGSQRVAMRTSAGVTYLHSDHLGSTSVASNASGALVARQTYYAYGAVRATNGTLPTDYTFTGQKVDASAGLLYYGARYYDAALGRFIQPDTIIPDQYNPQSLNRYAYVYNNPLRYKDPSGHCPLCIVVVIGLKAIDYGWTAWDALQSVGTLIDPNATATAKNDAWGNLTLTVGAELIEPDDLLPVGLPLDDLARVGIIGGLRNAGKEVTEQQLKNLPAQIHHIASDKSAKWTKQFEKIIKDFGLDLDGEWNKIKDFPHKTGWSGGGGHPDAYHEWVLERMEDIAKRATHAKDKTTKFLELWEKEVKSFVREHPEMLFDEWW